MAVAVALTAAMAPAAADGRRPVVVELYTSQGCSSCPPADALLARLADRRDVIALSLPITYWDMLGWKDTLASEDNTRRQKAYAQAMGHGGVYTPQMIVDGVRDVVGSREGAVEAAIAARQSDASTVPVLLSSSGHELHVQVGGADGHTQEATVWLFDVLGKTTVGIRAGENGGRSITYRNVVRSVRAIAIWKGQPLTLDLPSGELATEPRDAFAVVVQQSGYGQVLGAAFVAGP